MASAFTIDQPGGAGAGTPGEARNDLWQSTQVDLTCTTIEATYLWEFMPDGIPVGSVAVINNSTSATADFTPDLPGSYRVRLTTNGGGPGNVTIKIAAVTADSGGTPIFDGIRDPAFDERPPENNFGGQTRGTAPDYKALLDYTASLPRGAGAIANDVLRYVGGTWVPTAGALFLNEAHSAVTGDVLRWNGSNWVKDSNAFFLDEVNGASVGQTLEWNGSAWAPVTPSGGGGTTQVLVYRPGSTQVDNNYTSWSDLMTAFAATKGLVFICFDIQDAAIQIPAGTYDFQWRAVFVGIPFSLNRVDIELLTGAECRNVIGFQDLSITCSAVAGAYNFTWGVNPVTLRLVNTVIIGNGDSVGYGMRFNNAYCVMHLINQSNPFYNLSAPIKVETGKTLYVYVDGSSNLQQDTVDGGGSLQVYSTGIDAVVETQAGIGTFGDNSFLRKHIPRLPTAIPYHGVAGVQTYDDVSWRTIGVVEVDPSILPGTGGGVTRTITFRAVVLVDVTATTISVRLVDESGATVNNSTLTSTAAAEIDIERLSATLTLGASPDFQNARQAYKVQIRRNGGSGTDRVLCYSALVEFSYVTT